MDNLIYEDKILPLAGGSTNFFSLEPMILPSLLSWSLLTASLVMWRWAIIACNRSRSYEIRDVLFRIKVNLTPQIIRKSTHIVWHQIVYTFCRECSNCATICIWTRAWAVLLSSRTCSVPTCFRNATISEKCDSHPGHWQAPWWNNGCWGRPPLLFGKEAESCRILSPTIIWWDNKISKSILSEFENMCKVMR